MTVWNLMRLDLRKMISLRMLLVIYLGIFIVCEGAGLKENHFATSFGFIFMIYLWVYGPSGYGGDQLYGILPVSRRQVVLGRYAFSLAGILLLGIAISVVTRLISGSSMEGRAVWIFSVGCIFAAAALPPLLYFGPLKARFYVMAVYALGIAGSTIFGSLALEPGRQATVHPGLGTACISFALLVISCLITMRLFRRREFSA